MRRTRYWVIPTIVVVAFFIFWFIRNYGILSLRESPFDYSIHQTPRVFAYHLPIHASPLTQPDPGVHVYVEPDLGPNLIVQEVEVWFRRTQEADETRQECDPVDGPPVTRWRCAFEPAQGLQRASYRARVLVSDGHWVETARSYQTQTGTPSGDPTVFPLRVPLPRPGYQIDETNRIDVLLVWDSAAKSGNPEFYYNSRHFFRDVQKAIYEDVLSDPVYRWRDSQIAFWTYTRTGMTRGYYSPRNTRCGQNPWLGEWPAELDFAEVVGVVHLREEGRAPPGTDPKRDCAGRAVPRPDVGTFSARGDLRLVLKHELSHAAFGVGDEYDETDAEATVPGEVFPAQRPDCCCLLPAEDSTGTSGGGTGTTTTETTVIDLDLGLGSNLRVKCVSEEGTTVTEVSSLVSPDGLLPCEDFDFGEDCSVSGALPELCPPKGVSCVLESAFLGGEVPGDIARYNRFGSPEECEEARGKALAHPGVESAADGLGECNPICGTAGTIPCSCAPSAKAWHVDLDPTFSSAIDDLMAQLPDTPSFLGSTCAWCVETSLCVRWQRALGDSPGAAWAHCESPTD